LGADILNVVGSLWFGLEEKMCLFDELLMEEESEDSSHSHAPKALSLSTLVQSYPGTSTGDDLRCEPPDTTCAEVRGLQLVELAAWWLLPCPLVHKRGERQYDVRFVELFITVMELVGSELSSPYLAEAAACEGV
ncbi:hypothetical protein KCU85_g329, partial [Aureobasidium melanogenum]